MKKYYFLIFCFSLTVIFSSCRKEKSRVMQVEEFREGLTKEDTTQMLKISNDCMELLKAKKYNEAMASLYLYDEENKSLLPLTDEAKKHLERRFKMFPVLEYKLMYYSFLLEGVNDVKYSIKFAEEPNPEQNGEAKTAFMLNPVKVDGTWYLTVKNGGDFDELQN